MLYAKRMTRRQNIPADGKIEEYILHLEDIHFRDKQASTQERLGFRLGKAIELRGLTREAFGSEYGAAEQVISAKVNGNIAISDSQALAYASKLDIDPLLLRDAALKAQEHNAAINWRGNISLNATEDPTKKGVFYLEPQGRITVRVGSPAKA